MNDLYILPSGWTETVFQHENTGHKIRYVKIAASAPIANLFILPGLSEFAEKYAETAAFFSENGYNIIIIDWAYQGLSSRLAENRDKRHSDGYNADLADLDRLIHIHENGFPNFILAHSMGGHIALRFLAQNKRIIQAASLSAPLLQIQAIKKHTTPLLHLLEGMRLFDKDYIWGGRNWHQDSRKGDGTDIFSSDPKRDSLHIGWQVRNPKLQVGNPTFKWLFETVKSGKILKAWLHDIETPLLIFKAGREKLVSNKAIDEAATKLPECKLIDLPTAKHEILMETNDIRDEVLKKTINFFNCHF